MGPAMRNMAIRTNRAHAAAVGEMDCSLELCVNVVSHLVTAGAKFLRIGELHRGVEAAPEQDAADKAANSQK